MAAKSFVSSVETVEPGEGVGPASVLALDLVLLIANLSRLAVDCCLLIALLSVFKEPVPGFPITGSRDHLIT
jgi:hypothetical protein